MEDTRKIEGQWHARPGKFEQRYPQKAISCNPSGQTSVLQSKNRHISCNCFSYTQ